MEPNRGATRRSFLVKAGVLSGALAGFGVGWGGRVWAETLERRTAGPGGELEARFPNTWQSRQFLADLLDPELNLLPEYRGAKVYWLFHDNYLAAKVLDSSHPEIAAKLRAAMKAHGVERSGKIEIVFNEAPDALPFRHYELTDVAHVGDKVIRTERVKEGLLKGWEVYADLRFLAALARNAETMRRDGLAHLPKWKAAMAEHDAGWAMWDGVGFRDRVVEVHGRYATYKLALGVLASCRLGRGINARVNDDHAKAFAQAVERMEGLRNELGGWITDYAPDGKPLGLANVETTSLCIMALETALEAAAALRGCGIYL